MITDIWYKYRTPEGVALLGTVFQVEYRCDRPFTEEQDWLCEKLLRPAVEEVVEDITRSLRHSI